MTFETLAREARLVGLHEADGLQGELRDRVHAVEGRLGSLDAPAARIAMLMMRRHEKDFIARLDPNYAAEVKARLPDFVAALDAAAPPADLRRDLMRNMNAYQEAFARFATGVLAEQAANGQLAGQYREVEPRLSRMDEIFRARAEAAQKAGDAMAVFTRRLVLLAMGGVIVVVAGLSWLVGRGIARPILAVTRAMEALVLGELDTTLPDDRRRDEIGMMARTVRVFRDSLVDAARLREEQAGAQVAAEAAKRAALTAMAEKIEAEAGDAVRRIGDRTTAMTATAEEMRKLAARVGHSAAGANEAASLALANAQTVASAAEQLSASIGEISGQVHHSTATVTLAVDASNATRATIEALNERVGRIGAVAEIIGDIAAKTNLLALNATIEAARAGEAGKGFAVVASEVKQLANQTARSTEEINRHIGEVRSATTEAVTAVARIATTIGEVNAIAGSIAAAVEEQGAATAEIARGVSSTAAAVDAMTARNGEVTHEAEMAGRHASEVLDGTRVLDSAVAELRQALIRTVRTSTAEVDRRMFQRHDVDLTCRLELPGLGPVDARVSDVSEGGARLTGAAGLTPGTRGTLRMAGLATPLAFTVRGTEGAATRVTFTLDDISRVALRRMLSAGAPRAAA
jgi:methyl-accepting chemotaxis protein